MCIETIIDDDYITRGNKTCVWKLQRLDVIHVYLSVCAESDHAQHPCTALCSAPHQQICIIMETVLLHAIGAPGERGGIAPTHS
jgi:hypothetical protein